MEVWSAIGPRDLAEKQSTNSLLDHQLGSLWLLRIRDFLWMTADSTEETKRVLLLKFLLDQRNPGPDERSCN